MWAFHELIALPCGRKYSMPLGLLGGPPWFYRAFRESGLYEHGYDCLFLLSPLDFTLFYKSLIHKLEKELRYESDNPVPDPSLGSWYYCFPVLVSSGFEYNLYYCDKIHKLYEITYPGYVRGKGCFLELLIILSRVKAGIWIPNKDVIEYLDNCVRRSIRDGEIRDITRRVVQSILEIV